MERDEPKETMQAFAASEERFRLLVESSPNALVMVDAGGFITLLNRQAEPLFGYPREELLGKSVDLLVPPRMRQRHPGYRAEFRAGPKQRPWAPGATSTRFAKTGAKCPWRSG